MSQNPFTAPAAVLDQNPDDAAGKIGRVWGWVFAAPFLLLVPTFIPALTLYWRTRDWPDVFAGLMLMMISGGLAIWAIGSGVWWSRRPVAWRWLPLIGSALVVGGAGTVFFFTGIFAIDAVIHNGLLSRLSLSDAMSVLGAWLGLSFCTLVQGWLIRRALQRRARKQA